MCASRKCVIVHLYGKRSGRTVIDCFRSIYSTTENNSYDVDDVAKLKWGASVRQQSHPCSVDDTVAFVMANSNDIPRRHIGCICWLAVQEFRMEHIMIYQLVLQVTHSPKIRMNMHEHWAHPVHPLWVYEWKWKCLSRVSQQAAKMAWQIGRQQVHNDLVACQLSLCTSHDTREMRWFWYNSHHLSSQRQRSEIHALVVCVWARAIFLVNP